MLHLFYNLLAMINAEFSSLLERSYAGNTVQGLLSALLVFLIALAALYAARRVLLSRLKLLAARTATDIDDFFIHLLEKIGSFELALLSLYLATRSLALSAGVDKALHLVFVIALSFRAVTLLQAAIAFGLRKAMGSSEREADSSSAMQVLHLVLNVAVWAGAIIFILDNLGINISAMVAGLGIGGVAVALAAQQILGDLFSSFVIFMDKPFAIGDFIVLGDIRGTVERVGIKTTRVRSLSGELLVVPNKDLTSSVLRNYKQMQRRRIVMSFGVTYDTPPDKLKMIPEFIREAVAAAPKTALDRAHFASFGDSALQFEAVYFVETGDYNTYMDAQQDINLRLVERFKTEGIAFAFPTRTVVLQQKP